MDNKTVSVVALTEFYCDGNRSPGFPAFKVSPAMAKLLKEQKLAGVPPKAKAK
jgi:hypothetical protein